MASITMTASSLITKTFVGQSPSTSRPGRLVVANAAKGTEVDNVKLSGETKQENAKGRRDLVFAAAAAAVCSVARTAAAEEPERGTPEAKKKYAQVCVSNPTARICRK